MNKAAKLFDGMAKASAIVFAVTLSFIYLADWVVALGSPYSIMYEGPILMLGDMIAKGSNIYSPDTLKTEPWMVCIYPPLYLLCTGVLVKLFGLTYIPLRVFSMLCCAVSACLSYRIFRASGCNGISSLTATAFLFSFNAIYGWTYVARPDMLVTVLSLWLVEYFVSTLSVKSSSANALSEVSDNGVTKEIAKPSRMSGQLPLILISLLALFAKQQAAVFVLALAIYLLIRKQHKQAFIYVGICIVLFAALLGLTQVITAGFLQHLSFLSGVRSSSAVFIQNIASLGLDWFKVLFVLVAIPAGLFFLKKQPQLQKLPLLLFLISVSVAYFSMSIPGSNVNHLFPSMFAISWLLAFMMTSMPSWLIPAVVLCAAPSLIQISETFRYAPQLLPFANKSAAELRKFDLKEKTVLTDDPYINYMTDSKPVFEDCVTFLNVWANKEGGFTTLNSNIENKKYAAIAINSADVSGEGGPGWWPKETIDAIKKSYSKRAELNCSGWALDFWVPTP